MGITSGSEGKIVAKKAWPRKPPPPNFQRSLPLIGLIFVRPCEGSAQARRRLRLPALPDPVTRPPRQMPEM
jgi:hypothetical protein